MKFDRHDLVLVLAIMCVVIGLLWWAAVFDFAFIGQVETGTLIGFGAGLIVLWFVEQRRYDERSKPA